MVLPLHYRGSGVFDLEGLQKTFCGKQPHLVNRLADGSQWRRQVRRGQRIIEHDQRDVLRYTQLVPSQNLQRRERHQVIRGENRGRQTH